MKYFKNIGKKKKYFISLVSNGVQAKHTFIKTSNHKLFAFGNNTYSQIPQISKTEHIVPIPIEMKYDHDKIHIINIQCGEDFSLFLTATICFGCGSNNMVN